MIFLVGRSDFNIRYDVDSGREVDLGVLVDTADSGHLVSVPHGELLKE
jgi:hypothetical protein